MKRRDEFVKRLQNIKIEKEPRTEGFELTEQKVKEQLEKYNKVITSKMFKSAISGEER